MLVDQVIDAYGCIPAYSDSAPFAGPHLNTHSYRSLWISDLHLGTRACKAESLLSFLRVHEAEYLYLVGDIVDGWNRGPSWYWSAAQEAVVHEIGAWRRRGVRVVLLPGNHDETHPDLIEGRFGSICVRSELVHKTADGRRMLVLHGHQLDRSLCARKIGSIVKGRAYSLALRIYGWSMRQSHHRLSTHSYKRLLIRAIKNLTDTQFSEGDVLRSARQYNADGIICGHSHRPEQLSIGPLQYISDGDWVHSCTALGEKFDGSTSLIQWRRGKLPNPDFPAGASAKILQ